jgi:hypothetical protein
MTEVAAKMAAERIGVTHDVSYLLIRTHSTGAHDPKFEMQIFSLAIPILAVPSWLR